MQRLLIAIALILAPVFATAQDTRWVQVEAQPSILEAEARARDYSKSLNDVQAYSIGAGWYAITMGPYDETTARQLLAGLLQGGLVPSDSFVSTGRNYRQRIWPIGDLPTPAADPTIAAEPIAVEPAAAPVVIAEQPVQAADETPAQARAVEAQLSRDAKMALQRQLAWAGVYNGAVDGAFGQGTRAAMADWQTQNGFDATGILTTAQRAELRNQYDAVLSDLGLDNLTDANAGISVDFPMAVLKFDRYAPPLAHYAATDGTEKQAFLISQIGNRDDMVALFTVLQGLAIVPMNATSQLNKTDFTIAGETATAWVRIRGAQYNDTIKGYGIVWPKGSQDQFDRLINRIDETFSPQNGALSPELAAVIVPSTDLVYGLDTRRPMFTRSGVYISADGKIATASVDLDQCKNILIEGEIPAEMTMPIDGIAVLTPTTDIAPLGTNNTVAATASIGQPVYLGSFPYGGKLSAATITKGTIENGQGIDGSDGKILMTLNAHDGDLGGPVMDQSGNLVGILTKPNVTDRQLPPDAQVAINVLTDPARTALGLKPAQSSNTPLTGDAFTASLGQSIAFFECWGE